MNFGITFLYRTRLFYLLFFFLFLSGQLALAQISAGMAIPKADSVHFGESTVIKLKGYTGSHIRWQRDSLGFFVDIIPYQTDDTVVTSALTTLSKYRAIVSSSDFSINDTSTVAIVYMYSSTIAAGVTITPNKTSVCKGQEVIFMLSSAQDKGIIKWQSKTTGIFADIPGASSASYHTGALTETTSYRAITVSTAGNDTSNVVEITVTPLPVPGEAKTDKAQFCSGGSATITLSNASTGASIQWQSKTTGGFSNIAGAVSSSLNTGILAQTTSYRAIVTLNTCSDTSTVAVVTVLPNSIPGTISGVSTLCMGDSTELTLTGYSGTIQWEKSDGAQFIPIPGATTDKLNTHALTDTVTYIVEVRANNGCVSYSNKFNLIVKPKPAAGVIQATKTELCSGDTATIFLNNASAGVAVQWQSKTTGGFSNITGANSSFLNTGILAQTTSYRAVVTLNSCSDTSAITTITVKPIPLAGIISGINTVCEGDSTELTLTGYTGSIQWQKSTGSAPFTPIFGAVTDKLYTHKLTETTAYRVAVTASNGCIAYANKLDVVVNPKPIAGELKADRTTICNNESANITLVGATTGVTVRWQGTTTGVFGDIPNVNGLTFNTGVLTQTSSYRTIVTLNSCSDTSGVITITVKPNPVSGTISGINQLCSGDSTELTLTGNTGTVQWQKKTVATAFASIAGATSTNLNTHALTTTTIYRAVVTSLDGCISYSNEFTVTVIPKPNAGTASADKSSICSDDNATLTLSNASANSSVQWQIKISGAYSNISGATSATYNTGALTQTTTYRAVVTLNSCSEASNEVTITVTPKPTAGIAASVDKMPICTGENANLALSGFSTGSSIQWQRKTSGNFSDIPNATAATFNTGSLTQTTTYRAVVTLNSCSEVSNEVIVTVNPKPTAGTVSVDKSIICSGGNANLTFSNASTGSSIQWQRKTSGNFSDIPSATAATFNTGSITQTTIYRVVVTLNSCSEISNEQTVTVNPEPVAGTITPAISNICINTSTTLALDGYVGSSFQWEASTSPSGPFSNINQSNSVYVTPILNDTMYYRVKVAQVGCSNPATSPVAAVNVLPLSNAGTATANPTDICMSETSTITLSGYVGHIQWQIKTVNGFVDISNETKAHLITAALTTNTTYRAKVTSGNCPPEYSNEVLITIKPSSVGGEATADNGTVCLNTSTVIRLLNYSGTIQWQSDASGTFADIGGATGAIYTTPGLTKNPTRFRAKVTSGNCPEVYSTIATVSIAPSSVGGEISPKDPQVCMGASITLTLSAYSGNTIQWEQNEGSGYNPIAGAIGDKYTTLALTKGTNYRVKVTNGNCPSAYSTVSNVTITPGLQGGEAKANPGSVCSGGSSLITLVNNTGSSYQWQQYDGTVWQNIPGAKDAPYQALNLTTAMSYRAIVSSASCPQDTSQIVQVSIVPVSVAGNATAEKEHICSGTNTRLTLNGSVVGNIQWQVDENNTGTFIDYSGAGATSTSFQTPNLTKNTAYRAKVTSNSCAPAYSNVVLITVDPAPNAGTINTPTTSVCEKTNVTLKLTGYSGSIQWQTYSSGTFVNIPSQQLDSLIAFITTDTTFRVVVTNGVCNPVYSSSVTIKIAPALQGGNAKATPETVCSGTTSVIHLTGHTGSIQWQSSTDAGVTYTDLPGKNDTVLITNPVNVTTYFRAYLSSGTCTPAFSTPAIVSVIPSSVAGSISADLSTICSGSKANLMVSGSVGAIQWQTDNGGGATYTNIIGATSSNYTTEALTKNTNYRVVVTSAGCSSVTSAPILISIIPVAQGGTATAVQSQVCSGGITTINLKDEVGTSIQWQILKGSDYVDTAGATGKSFTTPPLNAPTTSASYRVRVKNGNCADAYSNTVTITITPALSGGEAIAQPSSICAETNTTIKLQNHTGSKINWQVYTNGAFIDVAPPATDSVFQTPNLTTLTRYRARVNGSGCAEVFSQQATVTIIPKSIGGNASSNPSTICSGETSIVSLANNAGDIIWQSDESGVFKDIEPNITGSNFRTPVLLVPTSFRAKVTSNHCAPAYSSVTLINVEPASVGGFATATASSICTGGTTTLNLTGSKGAIQWQQSATQGGGFVDISGATGTSYTITGLTTNTVFRAKVVNSACAPALSNDVEITITDILKGGTATAVDPIICKGTFTTLTLTGYTGAVQWQSDASGTFQDIVDANNASYTTPNLFAPTSFRAVVTSGACTPATSTIAIVSVTPSSVSGIATPNVSTVCSGGSVEIVLRDNIGSIQWQSNEGGFFNDIPGATGSKLVTTALTAGTTFRAVVTSGSCAPALSNEVIISILPASNAGQATASALKVCAGGTSTLKLANYTGSIQWQKDSLGVFVNVSGATGNSYTTPAIYNEINYRAVVTNGFCASVVSNTIAITLTPKLSAGTITATPSSICKGTSALITISNHSGAVQWQSNASTTFIDIPNATDTFYVTPALSTLTSYRAILSSGGCPSVVSDTATITIVPSSVAGVANAANASVCKGDTTVLTLTGYAGAIQWQSNESGVFTDVSGATSNSYITQHLIKTTAFRAIVKNGNCAPDTSNTLTVNLYPEAIGGIPTAIATTVCRGGTTILTLTNYSGSIQWQKSTKDNFENINGATASSYSTDVILEPTEYRAVVSNSTCPSVTSEIIKIKITDALEAGSATAYPSTICENSTTAIHLAGHKGQIQWQVRDNSGKFNDIPGAMNNPYVTSSLTENTVYRARLFGGNCSDVYSRPVTVYTVTQLSKGTITSIPSTVCSGEESTLVIGGHTGNVQWQRDSLGIFVNIPDATKDSCIVKSLTGTGPFVYRAVMSSGGCNSVTADPYIINVTVAETLKGDAIQQFCSVTHPRIRDIVVSNNPALDPVKWYLSPIGGAALDLTTPLTNDMSYYASRVSYGCESVQRLKVTAKVYSSVVVTKHPQNANTCPETTIKFEVLGEGFGQPVYRWMVRENISNSYKYITDTNLYKGITDPVLIIPSVKENMESYSFKCVIKGNCSINDSVVSNDGMIFLSEKTNILKQPVSPVLCYNEPAAFNIAASGKFLNYQWQIDSTGAFVDLKDNADFSNTLGTALAIKEFRPGMEKFKFRCVIRSAYCEEVVTTTNEVHLSYNENCNTIVVNVPTGFSPNDDGVNDKLVIAGIENYPNAAVRIYDIWGDLVYEKINYHNDWDARPNVKYVFGEGKVPAGTYYIFIDLAPGSKQKGRGSFLIIKY